MRDLDPAIVLRWIERHRVTNALSVPAVLRVLTATPGVDAIDFRSLRAIRLRGVAHLLRAAGKACGETVNAIVVGEPGRAASDAELIAWCRARRAHSI